MDRRDFLRKGALASGLAAALPQRLAGAAPGPPLPDMERYLATIDRGLEHIGGWSITSAYPSFTGDRLAIDQLARGSMQSLYITGMFRDLPIEGQIHPGIQDRILALQPTIDASSDGMRDLLTRQTPQDLARIRGALRTDAGLRHRITDGIDAEVAKSGISEARRRQTRSMFDLVGWRLENQSPALLVDEYIDKIDRVAASDIEGEARQRWMASKVSERVFWEVQEQSRREARISRGLRRMGIGVLIFGVSAIVLGSIDGSIDEDGALWIPAIGMTVGSVFFVIGFFTLLVGLGTSEEAG